MKKLGIIIGSLLIAIGAWASIQVYDSSDAEVGIFSELKCAADLTCSQVSGQLSLDVTGPLTVTSGTFSTTLGVTGAATFSSTVGVTGLLTASGGIAGDGGDSVVGFLQDRVLATATTITAAQCGSTFYNGGAVQMELPEASTVLGCRLTFITANASNFDINPDDADQILVETNAAGDAMRNATLGNSITIEALSASEWAPVATIGTWADID